MVIWSLGKLLGKFTFRLWKCTSMSYTPKLSRFVWGTLRFDSIPTLRLDSIHTESHLANQLPACRINRRGNNSHWFDGIGFTNWFPVCRIRINSSWVYWTTLVHVGLILIHSLSGEGVVYFSCYSDQGCSWIFATSTSGIKFDQSLCLMLVLYVFRPSINVYTD